MRNITADVYSGVGKDDIFDVTPHAIALTEKMLEQKDSYALPRKYKISFSSSPADRGHATLIDVGFIAKIEGGKRGFHTFIAGGMGAKSRVGVSFIDFLPEDEIFLLSQAIKEVFDARGNRKNKHSARLRFLVEEIGLEEFRKLVNAKVAEVKARGNWQISLKPIAEVSPLDYKGEPDLDDAHLIWWNRFVFAQKQSGYFGVKVPLMLGDLLAENAKELAAQLEKIAGDRDVLRFGSDQNIYIRNLTADEIVSLYPSLYKISPLVSKPTVLGDAVTCTGAATCQLGITIPRGAFAAIEKRLETDKLDLDALRDLKIHLSGCPNSCGRHLVADLGFFGKASRNNGILYPAYNVVAGARIGEENTVFAQKIADISAFHLPAFTSDLLKHWIGIKNSYKSFADWIDERGKEFIETLAQKYAEIPSFDEDKNPYYDYSAPEQFSLAGRGAGECSAGMYDLIEADKKALLAAIKEGNTEENLTLIRLLATRMLLITRGEEARIEAEVFAAFRKYFVETKLIDDRFLPLLDGAATAAVRELANAVIALYDTMDNTLKFAAEKTGAMGGGESAKSDRFKDYRGVACPMNFVKVKMDLSQMKSGELLEILLDDGAPIDNVPKSVKSEGHTIEAQTKEGVAWRVRIRKK